MPILKYTTIIRDPVHGYIHLNKLEREIINTKIFLRLQNIKQSPTAYLTYPAHCVDRYIHSLGTMELLSKIIYAAFENSREEIIDKVLKSAAKDLNIVKNKKTEVIKKSIIQLARLTGLLHDLGHLPFSHLGEGAVSGFTLKLYRKDTDFKRFTLSGKLPSLHEFATYKLIKKDIELKKIFSGENAIYKHWLLKVFEPEAVGIFKTIHDIIAGDIDADRADYLIRDGKTSGLGFGEYDLMRLVDSMMFYKDEDNKFIIVPTTAALSSTEAFLIERYKIYKWLCHHQHVVLTDTALSYLLRKLIEWNKKKEHPLANIVKLYDFHYRNYISDRIPFDDLNLWGRLRETFKLIQKIKNKNKYNKWKDNLVLAEILLRILLFREGYAKAIFKNPFEYKSYDLQLRSYFQEKAAHAENLSKEPILNIYAKNIAGTKPLSENKRFDYFLADENQFIMETERTTFRPFTYTMKKVEHPIQGLDDQMFLKKEYVSKFFLVHKNTGEKLPISDLSQLVRHLLYAWKNDMQLFLYIVCFKKPKSGEWNKIIDKAREKMKGYLVELWDKGLLKYS